MRYGPSACDGKRQLGMVGMEVSGDKIWVVAPPCLGLRDLARMIRTDSAERGHILVEQVYTTQILMTRITQHALQSYQ
eukprot:12879903-Prorocentrum_lima.AAC.1